jgi:hypothetical protein
MRAVYCQFGACVRVRVCNPRPPFRPPTLCCARGCSIPASEMAPRPSTSLIMENLTTNQHHSAHFYQQSHVNKHTRWVSSRSRSRRGRVGESDEESNAHRFLCFHCPDVLRRSNWISCASSSAWDDVGWECVCVSKKTDKTSFCSLAALLINCTVRSQQEQNLFAFVVLACQCPNLQFYCFTSSIKSYHFVKSYNCFQSINSTIIDVTPCIFWSNPFLIVSITCLYWQRQE